MLATVIVSQLVEPDRDNTHGRGKYNCIAGSVTRLGNLLDFGQLFKAFGNN